MTKAVTTTKKVVSKAVSVVASPEALAELKNAFPQEQGFTKIMLPRLGMYSQDQTEGKGKQTKVTTEAGTFYIEREVDGKDDDGNPAKVWEREEIGNEIEGIIIYNRKQMKFYDEAAEKFTSSPVYDTEDEIVPLFRDKKEIARGTPAELKARDEYQFTDTDGKEKSKLKDNRILYIIYENETYQMNIAGSSMYSFMSYARKVLAPSVITVMNSEPKEKGKIAWNQMTFTVKKALDDAEVQDVLSKVHEIQEGITQEKSFFASKDAGSAKAKKELDEF